MVPAHYTGDEKAMTDAFKEFVYLFLAGYGAGSILVDLVRLARRD